MRISHRHAVLAATAALLLAPGCSRSVATSAMVNENGTICVSRDERTWHSDATVPGVDPAKTWSVEGTFERTEDDTGTFTPDGSAVAVPLRGSPPRDPRLAVTCAIR